MKNWKIFGVNKYKMFNEKLEHFWRKKFKNFDKNNLNKKK